ncbi:MAG TPA: class I SAM-dependent methyltransferase [Candidatus Dormibacteraeota bacterium]|nr:class I SAM-dependent methyltransferase [Candidatus Dormibacteraeota bacterium]
MNGSNEGSAGERDPAAVQAMFDQIAGRYDLVNTLLSLGMDGGWRRVSATTAGLRPGEWGLDVAAGSGRLTDELARMVGPTGMAVGVDFSAGMLAVARTHHPRLALVQGDATALPIADASFDGATMAFGLRNLDDPVAGLVEMARVVRPGRRSVVLEFVRPPAGVVGTIYRLYLRHILPLVGGLISGRPAAYRYLSQTVDSYRTPEQLRALALEAGWEDVQIQTLTMKTVGVLSGRSPQATERSERPASG